MRPQWLFQLNVGTKSTNPCKSRLSGFVPKCGRDTPHTKRCRLFHIQYIQNSQTHGHMNLVGDKQNNLNLKSPSCRPLILPALHSRSLIPSPRTTVQYEALSFDIRRRPCEQRFCCIAAAGDQLWKQSIERQFDQSYCSIETRLIRIVDQDVHLRPGQACC
jgi:hypothetical protein